MWWEWGEGQACWGWKIFGPSEWSDWSGSIQPSKRFPPESVFCCWDFNTDLFFAELKGILRSLTWAADAVVMLDFTSSAMSLEGMFQFWISFNQYSFLFLLPGTFGFVQCQEGLWTVPWYVPGQKGHNVLKERFPSLELLTCFQITQSDIFQIWALTLVCDEWRVLGEQVEASLLSLIYFHHWTHREIFKI